MERPPIIAVLGHIDHGKSTLLDYIRKTKVAGQEAGGITQRVSAYEINHRRPNGQEKKITFIDTPGHEAFSSMREKGAAVADIAILVVSAEDGVKPQTLEAKAVIEKNHLPYLVAINKIDKPAADLERTKQSLTENGIYLEGQGGEVPWTAISAKTGAGVPELLDLVLLLAELTELKKNDGQTTSGFVLEAKNDSQKGIIATVIIKNGTLRRGDYLTTANDCFRIRKLEDFLGQDAADLTASSPALVLGWKTVPLTGGAWQAFAERGEAEACFETCFKKGSVNDTTSEIRPELAEGLDRSAAEGERLIPLIIKAESSGALEAVKKEVAKVGQAGIKFYFAATGIGAVTENDIKLGSASTDTIIIGFNVKIDKSVKDLADKYGLSINTFNIIYHLSEWLEKELIRRTPAVEVETVIGTAKVIKIFSQTKNKQIIGGLVLDGRIASRHQARIKRRGAILGDSRIEELRQQQIQVNEVTKGNQFGALVESRYALAVGDQFEILEIEKK